MQEQNERTTFIDNDNNRSTIFILYAHDICIA